MKILKKKQQKSLILNPFKILETQFESTFKAKFPFGKVSLTINPTY